MNKTSIPHSVNSINSAEPSQRRMKGIDVSTDMIRSPEEIVKGENEGAVAREYTENRDAGKTDYEAKKAVSPLLGHNRAEVTNVYLAGVKKNRDGDGNV